MKNIFYTFIIISLFSCQEFVNQKKGNGQVTISKREVTENFTKIETSEAIAVEIEQAENNKTLTNNRAIWGLFKNMGAKIIKMLRFCNEFYSLIISDD